MAARVPQRAGSYRGPPSVAYSPGHKTNARVRLLTAATPAFIMHPEAMTDVHTIGALATSPSSWFSLIRELAVVVVILCFILTVVMWPMIWGLRRVMAWIQVRIGPNRNGPEGLLQTPADALKLLAKEDIIPTAADRWPFIIAPIVVFVPALMVYVVVPFARFLVPRDLNVGIVYVSAVTAIPIIGIIMAGWASNSKWSLLGAFRAAAQLVSYEVPLVMSMMVPVMLSQSLSLQGIVNAQNVPLLGGALQGWWIFYPPVWLTFGVYLLAGLAESNCIPFDIMEAESELVAGFNTEYSGMKFAFFYLEEFTAQFTLAVIATTLFLGGWQPLFPGAENFGVDLLFAHFGWAFPAWLALVGPVIWFLGKCFVLVFIIMWIRSTLPRVRVDQLMSFAWKGMIPLAFVNLVFAGFWVVLR